LKFLRQIGVKVDAIMHVYHESDREIISKSDDDPGVLGNNKILFAHSYFNKQNKKKEWQGWPLEEMESAVT
jgi:hypothetical protein